MATDAEGIHIRDDELLGSIVNEVIERRRRGERPAAEEYAVQHPTLRERIEDHLRVLDLLEGSRNPVMLGESGSQPADPETGTSELNSALAQLPDRIRRVIVLRHGRNYAWEEIATSLGEPEERLRCDYARGIREVMVRCSII